MKVISVKAMENKTNKDRIRKIAIYATLILTSWVMIYPFIWMLSASFKPELEIFRYPVKWVPSPLYIDSFLKIWTEHNFIIYFINTTKVAVAVTLCQIITSSIAAYSFAKINYPGRDGIFLGYISTLMVPYQVIMVPQFIIMRSLGLMDTHSALILAAAFTPFGVFLFRQFYMGIPHDLSEAARIDGCSEFGIYSKIILPLSKPAIGSLMIFTFVDRWNDFLGPLIYINSDVKKTIQLAIRNFQTEYSSSYSLILAVAVISTLPTVIVYLSAQDFFVEGVASSGIKG